MIRLLVRNACRRTILCQLGGIFVNVSMMSRLLLIRQGKLDSRVGFLGRIINEQGRCLMEVYEGATVSLSRVSVGIGIYYSR